ncbi:Membrane-bound lytic murein transglycosylase B [Actinopolyspora mzabensis]|uniref:Membrane-bound lytic murein transglycosylase B n=1 Tax=Actinopolyspora mzabensis TaxID=995066 RepID=A0A1G8VPP2_ACTMZ|nr:lytic transglycosylase domain-containing protein [Actinopolyspora mzabensis]SDJ67847.1 Membrane-bound lytic murein transglycosylase B [Actinopolyspora mzabensis]
MPRRSRTSPWRRRDQPAWWPRHSESETLPNSTARRGPRRPSVGSLLALLALLLPFVLVGGANALTAAMFDAPGVGERSGTPPRQLGITGELPEQREPGVRLLRDSRSMRAASEPDTGAGSAVRVPDGPAGIPAPMLRAYRDAADRISETEPSCGLHWSVLAAIGRVESGHGDSGRVDDSGTTVTAILGPRLNGGAGFAAVPDTDAGELDGDPVWDRAVGAMQFLPATWDRYGVDGNDDGIASPHNAHDAALAAGKYLCAAGGDLSREEKLARAVFEYNHSERYVRDVLGWASAYRTGGHPTPAPDLPDLGPAAPERTGEAVHLPAPSEGPEPSGQRAPEEFAPLSPASPPKDEPSGNGPSFEPIVPETAQRPTGQSTSGGNEPGSGPSSDVAPAPSRSEQGDDSMGSSESAASGTPESRSAAEPTSSTGPDAEPSGGSAD